MLHCPRTGALTSSIKSHNYQIGLMLARLPTGLGSVSHTSTLLRHLWENQTLPTTSCLSPVLSSPGFQYVCTPKETGVTWRCESLGILWEREKWPYNPILSAHLLLLIPSTAQVRAQKNSWMFLGRGEWENKQQSSSWIMSEGSGSIW